jgi:hypothetical protein
MPMPESTTDTRTLLRTSGSGPTYTATQPPLGVNFSALLM